MLGRRMRHPPVRPSTLRYGSHRVRIGPDEFTSGAVAATRASLKSARRLESPRRGRAAVPSETANVEGSVSAVTDNGHGGRGIISGNLDGPFAMNPDGRINTALWTDFSSRGIHEMAVKTKLLAAAYYGKPAQHSYFDGCSTGGRQAHKTAQDYPDDYDGILAGAPAINWTRLIVGEVYPQIVMARDLNAPLTDAQLQLVSSAAVSACDTDLNGQHAGYISDPAMCRYDPTHEREVL